ncbi:UNVERIFIED_CONTAM: Protein-associating with the carboxyl-terminal domain of ezrin [Siphonaria sp. JEL0065]|nr:Protein-associating with the carboxyl-terminal domain of ezrin [Siphonaria sp. JEL0065]
MYTHYNAVEKETKEMVSIFTYGFTEKRDVGGAGKPSFAVKTKLPEKWIIINALQRLKTIRHPGIIKFKEAILTEAYLYVITEPVIPLSRMWNELPAEEIALGIFSTLKTISFLHNHNLCHNNIQFSSLYISVRERTWLLGGLEYTTPFQDINKAFTKSLQHSLPRELVPPEDFDPNVIPGRVEARDYFALGHLLTILLSPLVNTQNSSNRITKQESDVFDWRELQRMADMMTAMSPAKRVSVDQVLRNEVFSKNQFIFIVDSFLKNVRALEPSEKILGFNEPGIEIVLKDIFSQRTTNIDEAVENAGLLPSSIFINFVIPFISKNIKRREFDIRRTMLRLYPCYFEELFQADPNHFLTGIMPEILIGLNESSEEIYIQTLCVLCRTVPLLFRYELEKAKALSRAISIPSSIQLEAQLRRDSASTQDNRRYSTGGQSPKKAVGFTPLPAAVLVERFVIPRVLNACVDPQLTTASNVVLLKRIVELWKRLCVLESQHISLKPIVALLSSSFKSILSVLQKEIKYDFVTDILVGRIGSEYRREGEEHWMPKLIEILVPFLVSSDEQLRSIVADVVLQSVTVVAQYPPQQVELDFASPITDRRIERLGNIIVHNGPRRASFNFDEAALDLEYDLDQPKRSRSKSASNLKKHPPQLPAKVSFKNFDSSLSEADSDDQLPLAMLHKPVGVKERSASNIQPMKGTRKFSASKSALKKLPAQSPSQEFTEVSLVEGSDLSTFVDYGDSACPTPRPGFLSTKSFMKQSHSGSSTFGGSSVVSLGLVNPKGKLSGIPVPESWDETILADSILSALSQEDDG